MTFRKRRSNKRDKSAEAYARYLDSGTPLVEILLKDNTCIHGVIVGFYKGDPLREEPLITGWQITPPDEAPTMGTDILGTPVGKMVRHEEIVSMKFPGNNKVIRF